MDSDQKRKHASRRRDLMHRKSNHGNKIVSAQSVHQPLKSRTANKTPTNSDESDDGGKTFSRRKVVSNWSRYDALDMSVKHVSSAANFESLIQAPISEGGHFKFKSELAWEQPPAEKQNNIFSLDLKQLATSLSCVPFYNQVNLSRDLFTKDELLKMDDEVKMSVEKYNLCLKNKQVDEMTQKCINQESRSFHKLSRLVESGSSNPSSVTRETSLVEEDEELEYLLALKASVTEVTEKQVAAVVETAETSPPPEALSESVAKEDLEDWLDSMLDE